MRNQVLTHGERVDGRDLDTVRPISCEVGMLPRTHGSALFTRGQTQALVSVTLGTTRTSSASIRSTWRKRPPSRSCCTTTFRRSRLVKFQADRGTSRRK